MLYRFIRTLALSATFACGAVGAAAPSLSPYAVETGVKGVVDLYDLSSVVRTPGGFSIVKVIASNRLPQTFEVVAYRVDRETYHCGRGVYEVSAVEEYRRDGRLLNAMPGQPKGAMALVAGTASSEVYNRFCPAGSAGRLAGLAPVRTVQAASRFAAYRIGRDMLASGSR